MNWLDQNAIWLLLICGLSAAILLSGWIQTGRRALAWAAVIPAILAAALLLVQQWVVTDQEQVRKTLSEIARAVERNDVEAVLRYVDPESPQVADLARRELPQYEFGEVSIKRNLEIQVDRERDPPQAIAEFNVTVEVSERSGMLQNQRVPRFASVTFLLRGQRWLVAHYEHHPPQQGMMIREHESD